MSSGFKLSAERCWSFRKRLIRKRVFSLNSGREKGGAFLLVGKEFSKANAEGKKIKIKENIWNLLLKKAIFFCWKFIISKERKYTKTAQ
ncbi:protein of unknown function [Candidatus Methylacidiphilum fumarolicum]|uniref:Uncharacterized protein n=1 Tax=Candidatus Methylacidiphilum fumarolicum TaxID=591154 RepID=A0ABN8XAV4_9BACT|nr:protein of unknown function [Candidatus Methylacidiphilum fumarolicum]